MVPTPKRASWPSTPLSKSSPSFIMAGGFAFDDDDERPLIPSEDKKEKVPTPLPKLQLAVLLFFQLAEPITSQCIYPFINQVCSMSIAQEYM